MVGRRARRDVGAFEEPLAKAATRPGRLTRCRALVSGYGGPRDRFGLTVFSHKGSNRRRG